MKLIKVRNEVDRFGFSYILSNKFEIKKTPKSFACYLHFWLWLKDYKVEDFGYFYTPKNTPIIVAIEEQKDALKKCGFQNVHAGGLPFAYINTSNVRRRKNSLLIIPPHTIKDDIDSIYNNNFLTYILNIKFEFSEISFCLHVDDISNEEIINKLKKYNIKYEIGAYHADSTSLPRMREIFDKYDYVTSTVMGSHILYAAYCGCRVSILKKYYYKINSKSFEHDKIINSIEGCLERTLDMYNNINKLSKYFPWLFVDHPKQAVQMIDWAKEEIGANNILSKNKLMELLGWKLSSKIKAVVRICLRKFLNLIDLR